MQTIPTYQLFISSTCHCCDKVIHQLKLNQVNINTINIDKDEYNLPFSIMVLPALIKEEKIIAYGADDILKHLKKEPNYKPDTHNL